MLALNAKERKILGDTSIERKILLKYNSLHNVGRNLLARDTAWFVVLLNTL
jgi:hypothetical protein